MKKVYIDSTIGSLGLTNCNYWFNAFSNCTEVRGFENLFGMTSANQMFTSCSSLETIYATSSSNLGLSGSLMFNSCNRLVGGADGFVPSTTSGASVCKLGAGGVLTDPNDDRRTWFWAHFYADGEGVLAASPTPDSTRELVASNRICAIGKYVGLGFTPWDGVTGPTHRQHLTSATFAADMATFSCLMNYLFYSCTNRASCARRDPKGVVLLSRFRTQGDYARDGSDEGEWGYAHVEPLEPVEHRRGDGAFGIGEVPVEVGAVDGDERDEHDRQGCGKRDEQSAPQRHRLAPAPPRAPPLPMPSAPLQTCAPESTSPDFLIA